MTSAYQFLRDMDEDFGGDVKKFTSCRGHGGQAASSLNDARHNAEKAQEHDEQAQQHEGQAASNKSQGNRAIASLHSDAAGHHEALSLIHTNLAAKHLQKSKAQNLGEGFGRGYADADDLGSFDKYDLRKSPASRGELDNPRPHNSLATVQDMNHVVQKVAARHHASVSLVRVLGENGFVCSFVVGGGFYAAECF